MSVNFTLAWMKEGNIMKYAKTISTVLLLLGFGAAAYAACDNRDLRGEYLLTLAEVRYEYPPDSIAPVLNFCDHRGSLVFDGEGGVTGASTRRCNVTGTETQSGPMVLFVNPDCSFTLQDPGDPPDPVHGQIVDHGRMLLLDGSTRTSAYTLLLHGVAAKR